jgi:hypothetical protein
VGAKLNEATVLYYLLIVQNLKWNPHPLGGPDFDAFEPIQNPWTRDEEMDVVPEPLDAGAIMDVVADPDWVNPAQLERLVVGNEIEAQPAVVLPPSVTRGGARAQNIEFSFDLIVPNTKLSIKFMGIWKSAIAVRKRQDGSWRVKFDGRMGKSIDLKENDEEFPEVKFS